MWRTIALFICMILCWIIVPSHAAEISCVDTYDGRFDNKDARNLWPSGRMPIADVTCFSGLLQGQISKGDYEKVVTFLKAHHPFLGTFGLVSRGGDVDEALKIGRLFRKYLISTQAQFQFPQYDRRLPRRLDWDEAIATGVIVLDLFAAPDMPPCRGQDCTCASACALIWFGGVRRAGHVGVHRPQIMDPMFKGLSPADASTAYRRALASIAAYLDEMEVPKSIIESMVTTSSSDIRWVDAGNDGLERVPPSIAEWEYASCGSSAASVCTGRLLANNRDRLAPP